MNNKKIEFHHLGLATTSEDEAIKHLSSMGYNITNAVYDPLQEVYQQMCTSTYMPNIELIFTSNKSAKPLESILKKKISNIYHICYITSSTDLALKHFNSSGVRIMELRKPLPAKIFNNNLVSFYFIEGFGIIELLEAKISL